MPPVRSRLPLVDWLKAVASQLIVWHHFAFYGPMSDVAYPYAPAAFDWLYEYARMAVQVFLAVGGFLAARSLAAPGPLPRLLWRRYLRLAKPYWVAIIAATLAAWTLPTLPQALAHVVFLQDILHLQALSAGVWYVAIDFQLFVLLSLLMVYARRYYLAATLVLACLSLFWWNRNSDLDIYAVYFFGSYAMGVFAEWIARQPRKLLWILLLAVLAASALHVDFRGRILVAALTSLLLATGLAGGPTIRVVAWLSDISYEVFLLHYPVMVALGAFVSAHWPKTEAANALGLLAAWLISLSAGHLLHAALLRTPASTRTASAAPGTCS